MRATLCVFIAAVCVYADKNDDRKTKPFVADALGNTLPPPSNVPASVGSPVNLITPDRYEFYTFDESGELVKRLMTLEEIQAIVAAGEDSDGLVTFANDNQPTIAFNFSQPPFTKVHSVVTNVQNVLKAQMEAHKSKPQIHPTLDTPDVSDSWSLILPSIFGNTGVDIVPDKPTNGFTPETDTLETDLNVDDEENSLSKEGGVEISSTTVSEDDDKIAEAVKSTTTITEAPTTTTTVRTTTTTTRKPTTTTTTRKPTTTTTTRKPTTTTTTRKPTTSTTAKPTTTTTTTRKPTTTAKLRTTTTTTSTTSTTTASPSTTTTTTLKPTKARPTSPVPVVKITPRTTTTPKPSTTTTKAPTSTTTQSPTKKPTPVFEKLSTFIPTSTAKYGPQKTTLEALVSSQVPLVYASTTNRSSLTTTKLPTVTSTTSLPKISSTTTTTTSKPVIETISSTTVNNEDRINITTVTTQSVSPSTTVSSTELTSAFNGMKDTDPIIPLFDVAQSISQIASDLGNNYQPIPTTSNLLDTTKVNPMEDVESKEILDMDIPSGNDNEPSNVDEKVDNFVKITTIDPHPQDEEKVKVVDESKLKDDKTEEKIESTNYKIKEGNVESSTKAEVKSTTEAGTTENIDSSSSSQDNSDSTTIDPILSESMGDLLSQVANEKPQDVVDINKNPFKDSNEIPTAENVIETTTEVFETTSEFSTTIKNDPISTTVKTSAISEEKTPEQKLQEVSSTTAKIITKENSSAGNKKNEQETKKEGHKKEDFIQISVSKLEDSSKINNNKKKDSVLNEITSNLNIIEDKKKVANNETNTDKNKPGVEKNIQKPTKDDKQPISTTTVAPKVEITTTLSVSANVNDKIKQSSPIRVNSLDKNDNKKDKLPEPLPKIDEVKKKIQKVNIDDEELNSKRNNSWKLIPTVIPPKANDVQKDKIKSENGNEDKNVILEYSKENQGLEVTTKDLGEDIAQFAELCNELAFRYWNVLVENIDKRRSFVLSPYSITSMLAMMFMGARGATSGEMNEILKLDDMVTFNPHFTLKNISDSIETTPESGIIISAFIRELYSDRNKGKILTFYKERAQHFYSGHVEEINFKLISDIIRRRSNLLVKRYTWGKITEYMKSNSIVMNPPLAAFSANIFETDCTGSSVDGRDGEMYFVVSPNIRQRRLVPVPAVVFKSGFLAGYDPMLDATAAALGNTNSVVSTIFLMPGQQGNVVHSDDLEKLEQRLLDANPTKPVWSRVLRTLLPRPGLELQIPRFSHKSVFNVSSSLKEMGLKDLFDSNHADLGGLNGPSKDLYLSDMVQMTSFVTCGEGLVIGDQHHVEEYPDTMNLARRRTYRWLNDWDEPRDYQRAFHDPHDVVEAMHLPLHLRPRQARLPTRSVQPARLKFDRPFLFFVRHNPSGMILYVGRYNPRLLP